jgi:hypothetical protein
MSRGIPGRNSGGGKPSLASFSLTVPGGDLTGAVGTVSTHADYVPHNIPMTFSTQDTRQYLSRVIRSNMYILDSHPFSTPDRLQSSF